MNEKIILSLKEEPVDVFQAKEFKKLIKYATENQAQLESYWENESIENIQMFLKYATSKLSFFEKHIENDKKNHSIFRLGSLLGAVESYGNILYERKQQHTGYP